MNTSHRDRGMSDGAWPLLRFPHPSLLIHLGRPFVRVCVHYILTRARPPLSVCVFPSTQMFGGRISVSPPSFSTSVCCAGWPWGWSAYNSASPSNQHQPHTLPTCLPPSCLHLLSRRPQRVQYIYIYLYAFSSAPPLSPFRSSRALLFMSILTQFHEYMIVIMINRGVKLTHGRKPIKLKQAYALINISLDAHSVCVYLSRKCYHGQLGLQW